MTRCYCTLSLFALFLVVAGCTKSDPPRFQANRMALLDAEIVPDHEQQIADALESLFGTPDQPKVSDTSELDLELIKTAAGPVRSTTPGETLGLYRQHCAHCHGITGDGLGPTAALLNPYPRDFREGKFKFKSTYLKYPPTDNDLRRVLENGIPGTAMPSFKLLGDEQIDALVEYVKYLAQRGQVESELVYIIADELDYDPDKATTDDPFEPATDDDDADLLAEVVEIVEEDWYDAADNVVEPDAAQLPPQDRTAEQIAASIDAGRELFYGNKANCVKCHGNTGYGDGQQTDYDDWNKVVVEFREKTDVMAEKLAESKEPPSEREVRILAERQSAARARLKPRNASPRNLREVLHGGRRPIDIYWRLHQGIAGSPMPAHGSPRPGATGTLTDAEIWQLVDYVMAMTNGSTEPEGEQQPMAQR